MSEFAQQEEQKLDPVLFERVTIPFPDVSLASDMDIYSHASTCLRPIATDLCQE